MGKILLGNFPYPMQGFVGIAENDVSNEINVLTGFDHLSQEKIIRENTLIKFFTSFLIHDEIYLNYVEVLDIVGALGVQDAIEILRTNAIKIVDLDHFPCVMQRKGELNWQLTYMSPKENAVEFVTDQAKSKHSLVSGKSIAQLGLLVSDNLVRVDSSSWEAKITNELNFDLGNNAFKKILGVDADEASNLSHHDIPKIMRIANILGILTLQDSLKTDDVALDGYSELYLNKKFSVFSQSVNKSISAFENISRAKGIPPVYELYKAKVISVHDVISIRESCGGKIFRRWYESTDYDESAVLRAILNQQSERVGSKLARLVYPIVSGVMSPALGIVASAFDSFILSRVVEGWKPSLFLDDILKSSIDKKIDESTKAQKREALFKEFGGIERNAACPCGSGKKFKKCHGYAL